MSSFTLSLVVSPLPDGRNWKLVKPFTYHVGSKHSRFIIKVPKGFVTDFASVPQLLWFWLPYWGKYGKAAIVHDRLYHTRETSRRMADLIFYEAMQVEGTPKWKARLMYWGVRMGGYLSYKKRGVKTPLLD